MTERDQEIKNLVVDICRNFQTFGQGATSVAGNPIFEVLKDKPPMFALGVDVEMVVRFVLQKGRNVR